MKILQIIPALNKGGAERLVLDLCVVLQKMNEVEVKLITFRPDNSYSFLTEKIDWEIVPASVQLSISGKSKIEISKLQTAIENYQPDVIHSHLFESEMVLSQINYPKAKYVVHFHDNMVQYENFSLQTLLNKRKLTNIYEKKIVLKAYKSRPTQFIAISKNNLQYIQRNLLNNFSKTMLSNAIDLKRFNIATPNNDVFKIVIIGSLVMNKGHKLAVEIIEELKKRKLNVHLNILGEGSERKTIETLIDSLNLKNQISLLGNVDHPEDFLEKAHIYIHTSISEAFGLTIIEAMACGLPVVCTDGKGNRDLIHEGVNGFMIWKRDPLLLADKIELLIKDDVLRSHMGQNARKFAEGFGIEKYVDELLNFYSEIAPTSVLSANSL